MFDWLRNRMRPPPRKAETPTERFERIRAQMPDAVAALGEIMEKQVQYILPSAQLPLPKEEMKIALKMAWLSTSDERLREQVAVSYSFLGLFRDEILRPVDLLSLDQIEIQNAAFDEGATLSDEFNQFVNDYRQRKRRSSEPTIAQPIKGVLETRPEAKKLVMTLFEDADISTPLNLQAQVFLQELIDYAYHPKAPVEMREDLAIALDWLNVLHPNKLEKRHYEQFGRAFEQYLLEGKSPSGDLSEAFNKFKQWLKEIYPSGKVPGVTLTPEMRGVFDRMLDEGEGD